MIALSGAAAPRTARLAGRIRSQLPGQPVAQGQQRRMVAIGPAPAQVMHLALDAPQARAVEQQGGNDMLR
jgi:hypothetical protein